MLTFGALVSGVKGCDFGPCIVLHICAMVRPKIRKTWDREWRKQLLVVVGGVLMSIKTS